ncbi:DegT/DnrJ/EryC1/StrS aminotransferase family protein [uncultured Roseobacter sp.]|uniref:DegT/DnrJ/EryC1/StrS family aminotransferase n=1 Tax=uncultured Roseobacter sp. TaxID=114847 RepID=UPI0026221AAB|nr:DegT/DnrJ/EryC1/StrS aminotransferase family protein [uncultured Roseobacter sp.]
MQFIDLAAQQNQIRDRIDSRIATVLDHGVYIMGPEVVEFEEALADFSGAKNVVTCANGTDALLLALMAWGVQSGDAVFVPSFTFAATAEVVPCMGAVPVFVDIDPRTFNMASDSLRHAIAHVLEIGLRPAAVIPVDLFGLPADYDLITEIACAHEMPILADTAQGFGGIYKGSPSGTLGDVASTSFFPAKPLGCYGDGGALFTGDDDLAEHLRSLRVHGKGSDKYDNVRIGQNSRLDTLQAAILLEKLAIFTDELDARQRVADRYTSALSNLVTTPFVPDGLRSAWAQYTLKAETTADRSLIMAGLEEQGIPTGIYYPKPLHQQTAYGGFPIDPEGLPVTEDLAQRVFSLPMHPYLSEADQDRIIDVLYSLLPE